MIGGLVTSFLLELLVYPAIYKLWKRRELEAVARSGVESGGGGAPIP
jgi:Cu(I)/Ag(I) efflux system membrane protein CusA/SilA